MARPETLQYGPPGGGTPSIVSMVVLENGNYWPMTITPRPLPRRLDLEPGDSMPPRIKAIPDGPTNLLRTSTQRP